jgi:hypothetical protein
VSWSNRRTSLAVRRACVTRIVTEEIRNRRNGNKGTDNERERDDEEQTTKQQDEGSNRTDLACEFDQCDEGSNRPDPAHKFNRGDEGDESAALQTVREWDSESVPDLTGKLCWHVMALIRWKVGADKAVTERVVWVLEEWLRRQGTSIYTDRL